MRSGQVWTHGDNTELEAWIEGESRRVAVTREAIEGYLRLQPDVAAAMSHEERREFVREHTEEIIAAANRKVDPSDRAADLVTIRTGELEDC